MLESSFFLISFLVVFAASLVVFLFSYIAYLGMPAPKGCEKYKATKRNCDTCTSRGCEKYLKRYRKSRNRTQKTTQNQK
ncbi:MAG: hypothetical protein MJ228_04115 [Bacilli bacterium]|nr:hypothetical protein [Bacilli bacterium]